MPDLPKTKYKCGLCGHESTIFRDKKTDYVYCPVCQFPIGGSIAVPLGDTTLPKYIELCRKRMLILFHAPWDGLSHEFLPLFNNSVTLSGQHAVLVSVDISQNPECKRRYGITVTPVITIFENGHESNRIVGPVTRFDLERLITGGLM